VLRLKAQAVAPALDTRCLLAIASAAVRRWRELRFEGGCYVDDEGQRREGLRVEHGEHPQPGTRYRLVFPADDTAGASDAVAPSTMRFEIMADGADRARYRWEPDSGESYEVELERPANPARLGFTALVPVTAGWPMGGPVSVRVNCDVDRLPPASASEPQLTAKVAHRFASATARVHATQVAGGSWGVTVEVRAGGRGLMRPAAAVIAPFLRATAARALNDAVHRLVESAEEFNRELRDSCGPDGDPDRVADALFVEYLATVPERVP
jgi:hypothetical protein